MFLSTHCNVISIKDDKPFRHTLVGCEPTLYKTRHNSITFMYQNNMKMTCHHYAKL